jgi:hypothetical protein
MKRFLLPALLAWLALAASARAQRADTVYTIDKATGKEKTTEGKIKEESPAGIKIQTAKGVVTIPALEVRHVFYLTAVTALDYRKPFNLLDLAAKKRKQAERVEVLEQGLQGLKELEPQVAARAEATRYVKYRQAATLVQLAEQEPDKAARVDAAVSALVDYKTNYPNGWEIVPALKRLAELQEQKKDVAGALKTYEALGEVPDLPKAMKQQSDILVAHLYLRTKKPAEAERKLSGLRGSMAANDPQRPEVEVDLVESQMSQKKLDQVPELLKSALAATTNVGLKARGYNYLGDYYQMKNQSEDAFWQYLRVETVYNQNVEERAKALYQLSKLYDTVLHDRGRAAECAEKLRGKEFADTPYAKMLPSRSTEGR